MANVETKNTIERDETKEELAGLKNEVEKKNPIDKRVYLEVDSAFKKFYKERSDSDKVRLEKTHDWKLRLITHRQTCELDLKTNRYLFIKWGKAIDLGRIGIASGGTANRYLNRDNFNNLEWILTYSFKMMDMINKAIWISNKHHDNRKFYFNGENLMVDWEKVASVEKIRKAGFDVRVKDDHKNRKFLEMLNNIVA